MPRITLPTPDQMNEDQLKVFNKMISGPRGKVQGPIRAAIHNAELADRWQSLGALLRYNTSLTPRLSEIAILVTAKASQSPFEWYAHRIEAEKIGLEKASIGETMKIATEIRKRNGGKPPKHSNGRKYHYVPAIISATK